MRCETADFPVRRTRHLRFIELWEPGNWMLKIYFHSAHPDQLSREFLAKAKIFIEPQLVEAEQTEPLHRVGFVVLSHGAVSNWVMLDWWSSHIAVAITSRSARSKGNAPSVLARSAALI